MSTRRIHMAYIAGFSLLACLLLGNAAVSSSTAIKICVSKSDGAVRKISSTSKCKVSERTEYWQSQGAQGPKGDAGPQGPAGPQGLPGLVASPGGSMKIHVFDGDGADLGLWVGTMYSFGAHCVSTASVQSVTCFIPDGNVSTVTPDTQIMYFSGANCTGNLMMERNPDLLPSTYLSRPAFSAGSFTNTLSYGAFDRVILESPVSVLWDADSYVADATAQRLNGASRLRCVTYAANGSLPAPLAGVPVSDPSQVVGLTMPRMASFPKWDGYADLNNLPAPRTMPFTYRAVSY